MLPPICKDSMLVSMTNLPPTLSWVSLVVQRMFETHVVYNSSITWMVTNTHMIYYCGTSPMIECVAFKIIGGVVFKGSNLFQKVHIYMYEGTWLLFYYL